MGLTYRCLVVDDEPLARRVIKRYIADVSWLELAAECGSAREAAAYLYAHKVDVMFLDVRMPGLSGLDFLDALTHRPRVILTTAHSEYALVGYDYSVVDFLLKPVSFERFLKAANKLSAGDIPEPPDSRPAVDFMFVRADREDHRVRFSEIRYLEACGNYVKVHLDGGTIYVPETMASMEEKLPSDLFLRIHRSFVVSLERIDKVAGGTITIGPDDIPIGRSYRREIGRITERRR